MARLAETGLEDRKAGNIVLLDVRGASSVADCIVVATGNSAPHLKALSSAVQRAFKSRGIAVYRRAGDPESGWLLLDYLDVVIHLFSEVARLYYAIEELWKSVPRLDRTPSAAADSRRILRPPDPQA